MIVFKLILFTLFISGFHCKYPDKVYCANEGCTEPISKAKTLLHFNSVDSDHLSFRGNSDALVYMKSAGTNPELWFVSINGKSGFASSRFLREQKILVKNPQFILPYEPKKTEETVQPDKVQQAHEVFEGTTIYTTESAINSAEQDITTETPLTSPHEDTPSLDSKEDTVNENVDTTVENVPNQDEQQDEQQNSADLSQETATVDTTTEPPQQPQVPIVTDEGHGSSEPSGDQPATTEEIDSDKSEENKVENVQQVEQELPKELPSEISAQQLLSTLSGTLESEPLLEVPDNKEFNSLTEPEQTVNEQSNISTNNPNVENVQLNPETSSESNNGDINPVNVQSEDQSQQSIPQDTADIVQPIIESNNANQVQNDDDQTYKYQLPDGESFSSSLGTPPPYYNEETTTQETITELLPIQDPYSASSEWTTDTQTSSQTIPTEMPGSLLNVGYGTTPPYYTEETTTQQTTTESLPVQDPYSYSSEPIANAQTGSQTIPTEMPGSLLDVGYGTAPPYYTEETTTQQTATDSVPIQEPYSYSSEPTTNSQTDPSKQYQYDPSANTATENFPSSSEPTPAPYYAENPDEYPKYESEKSETSDEYVGFSFMQTLMDMYYSVMGTSEETKALFASHGETCYTDEYCDGTSNDGSNRLLTFLVTTASSVLLFTLGYYYIDNRRQDGRLIGQINSLQRDLLFTTKECEILKEELSSTKNKLAGIEDSSFGMDDMVQSLKEEINELKSTNERLRNSLDDNEKLLRVSENTAGELQNTLSEVENTLSELLTERANSEEQIVELNGKIQAFEEELISVSRDRDNFQLKYVSAESALEEFKKQKKQLEEINELLTDAKNTIELQKHEIDALKEAIKELKGGMPSNVDASSLIDHTEIKAKLSKALQEKKSFETKYEAEHKEKTRLAEELQTTQETLHTTSQNATEALTRLDVLGKYFQERESELMKELSAKESLWLSKQGESASTVEKIELLQQEVQRYKEKCDALTLELAEAESSRRTALSAVESRAHAAWLEARSAKRDADAARDDAAALRRKLAALSTISTADGAVSPHHKVASPLDSVENPVIPPPLPPMFLPPPLLPPLPRPPPLGRLPSPHPPRYGERRYTPERRYSPESRYSPDSRYSPETVRYSPDSRYSPRARRDAYSPRSRRRSRSRERYEETRGTRSRNGPADTETEYNSDSPTREPRRRGRYSRHSGPSSGSGCSSESDK